MGELGTMYQYSAEYQEYVKLIEKLTFIRDKLFKVIEPFDHPMCSERVKLVRQVVNKLEYVKNQLYVISSIHIRGIGYGKLDERILNAPNQPIIWNHLEQSDTNKESKSWISNTLEKLKNTFKNFRI